jgi:hypothetical protein
MGKGPALVPALFYWQHHKHSAAFPRFSPSDLFRSQFDALHWQNMPVLTTFTEIISGFRQVP